MHDAGVLVPVNANPAYYSGWKQLVEILVTYVGTLVETQPFKISYYGSLVISDLKASVKCLHAPPEDRLSSMADAAVRIPLYQVIHLRQSR